MGKSNRANYTQELEDKIIELNFKVRQLQQQLESNTEANHKVTSKLIHNLKNPIGVVYSFAEMIQDNLQNYPKEKLEKFLEAIHNSAKFSLDFLDRLALYLKVQSASNLKFDTINFTQLVENCAAEFKIKLSQNNVSIAFVNAVPVIVECNIELAKLAVNEIIDNAVKFSNENGTVNIGLQQVENQVKLEITNKGNPIPEKDLPFISEPFYVVNTYTENREKCLGLGLSLVDIIAQKHKGSLSISNLPAGEVCTTLMLPLKQL